MPVTDSAPGSTPDRLQRKLETLPDGPGVYLWKDAAGQVLYVGKAKRLRNNPAVRIMPSGFKGEPRGEWMKGKARFAEGAEAERAIQLRKKRYGMQAMLAGMIRRATTVIAIELNNL